MRSSLPPLPAGNNGTTRVVSGGPLENFNLSQLADEDAVLKMIKGMSVEEKEELARYVLRNSGELFSQSERSAASSSSRKSSRRKQKARDSSSSVLSQQSQKSNSSSADSASTRSINFDLPRLEEIGKALKANVEVADRRYHLSSYKQCFIGREAVDYLVESGSASTRQQAVEIGRALQTSTCLFAHVTRDHLFKDDYLFFRFLDETQRQNSMRDGDTLIDYDEIGRLAAAVSRTLGLRKQRSSSRKNTPTRRRRSSGASAAVGGGGDRDGGEPPSPSPRQGRLFQRHATLPPAVDASSSSQSAAVGP